MSHEDSEDASARVLMKINDDCTALYGVRVV